jgi:D-tyrosyl-tRNA(Tyr) deacylase
MRAVVQRVHQGRVVVDGETVGEIDRGLLVYLGAGRPDTAAQSAWTANKIRGLRIFEDAAGKMSESVEDISGSVLVVPQFTLYGDVRKGRRPSFDSAAEPVLAKQLYLEVVEALRATGLTVATGRFRESMRVQCEVDGPVTILIDSDKLF